MSLGKAKPGIMPSIHGPDFGLQSIVDLDDLIGLKGRKSLGSLNTIFFHHFLFWTKWHGKERPWSIHLNTWSLTLRSRGAHCPVLHIPVNSRPGTHFMPHWFCRGTGIASALAHSVNTLSIVPWRGLEPTHLRSVF